jgi:GGDEF domain-containing protein
LGALQFTITPSIGIARHPDHGTNGQTLVAHADAAMHRAKQLGIPCEFFEPPMAPGVSTRQPTD